MRALAFEVNPGYLGQLLEESILEAAIACCGRDGGWSAVMPDSPAADGVGTVADGEPGLGEVPLFEVVGGGGAAHAGGDPAGIDGVADESGQRRAAARASAVTKSLLSR